MSGSSETLFKLLETQVNLALFEQRWQDVISYCDKWISKDVSGDAGYYKRAYAQAALSYAQYQSADYFKVPEMAISLPIFDQPANHQTPKYYIICSEPRSGSFLLCRQLINAGLGVPHEYFNVLHHDLLGLQNRLDPKDLAAYWQFLLTHRTTPNQVFGMKLQWFQYQNNKIFLDKLMSELPIQYIFLYRKNLKAQAVSFYKALLSGQWGFDEAITTAPLPKPVDEADSLLKHHQGLLDSINNWQQFFIEKQVQPMLVAYEDFIQHPESTIQALAEQLGLAPEQYEIPPREPKPPATSAEDKSERKRLEALLEAALSAARR